MTPEKKRELLARWEKMAETMREPYRTRVFQLINDIRLGVVSP